MLIVNELLFIGNIEGKNLNHRGTQRNPQSFTEKDPVKLCAKLNDNAVVKELQTSASTKD